MPLNPAQIALLMARLPAASQQALEFLAKTKGKTPQEVFEECLREYIAGRVPQVDVSAALSTTRSKEKGRLYITALFHWVRDFCPDQASFSGSPLKSMCWNASGSSTDLEAPETSFANTSSIPSKSDSFTG